MVVDVWLNRRSQLVPGAVLYRSDRSFELYDYTPSHSQLLLRSFGDNGRNRIDVLFKPVKMVKTYGWYAGLEIRCATEDEQARIRRDTPEAKYDDDEFYFVLGPGSGFDYVVAMGVGWHEDQDLGEPSYYADPSGREAPRPKWQQTALWGTHGWLGSPMATTEEFADAIALPLPSERTRYRFVYVVVGLTPDLDRNVFGAFVVRSEAEECRQDLAERFPDGTFVVDAAPIAF
jgi:hypothetical protein